MDCYKIQGIGDSDSLDESAIEIDENERSNENQNDLNASENDRRRAEEKLYEKYKEALKLLQNNDYEKSEHLLNEILTSDLFENNLDSNSNDLEQSQKSLNQFKYVVLKNLSSICSKYKKDHQKSLKYLIEASKIDASDVNLWHEIGDMSLKSRRHLVSKQAFKQALLIDSCHWPSLNNLIILLYAIGDYSLCMKYVFEALDLDKFYIYGILVLDLLVKLDNEFITSAINRYMKQNEIESSEYEQILDSIPVSFKEGFSRRVDDIKSEHRMQIEDIKAENLKPITETIDLTIDRNKILTWLEVAQWILSSYNSIKDSNKSYNLKINFKVIPRDVTPDVQDVIESIIKSIEAKEAEKNASAVATPATREDVVIVATVDAVIKESVKSSSRGTKRGSYDPLAYDWSKRRSVRGAEKQDHADNTMLNILKKYVDNKYLTDQPVISQNKKSASNKSLKCDNEKVKSLKDSNEFEEVSAFLDFHAFSSEFSSILTIMNDFLRQLSRKSSCIWPPELITLYKNMYELYTKQHYDFFDALTSQQLDDSELNDIFYILLVYCELKFSKIKQEQLDKSYLDISKRISTNRQIQQLIHYLNQTQNIFMHYSLKIKFLNQTNIGIDASELKSILIRYLCLQLFVSFNLLSNETEASYYEEKISNELKTIDFDIFVPNSKIMNVINPNSITEFRLVNEKSRIFKIHDLILNLYSNEKYADVVQNLESYVDTFKLPIEDANFSMEPICLFINSYYNMKNYAKYTQYLSMISIQIVEYLNKAVHTHKIDRPKTEKIVSLYLKSFDQILSLLNERNKDLVEYKHHFVWILNQIITLFFENSELASKFESFKSIKPFLLLYNLLNNDASIQIKYIISIHEYLAGYHMCGANHSEFLLWAVEKLINFINTCERCSSSEQEEEKKKKSVAADREVEVDTSSNQNPVSSSSSSNSKPTTAAGTNNAANTKCSNCDNCNDQLEQLFSCLFGYKKSRVKYLTNHVVTKIDCTPENSLHLYRYFKPEEFPEYDSLKKLPNEYVEFLRNILTQIEEKIENTENAETEFIKALNSDSLDLLNSKIDNLKQTTVYEYQTDSYYMIADYTFKVSKEFNEASKFYIRDLLYNYDRFDSWANLALGESHELTEDCIEESIYIKSLDDLKSIMKRINTSINCFARALHLNPKESKLWIEYASFLYQLNSYFGRQLVMDNIIGYFEESSSAEIRELLKAKKSVYLKEALEAYKNAVKPASNEGEEEEEEQTEDEWLNYYMFGKIKEKLKSNVFDCLECYLKSLEYLDAAGPKYLKKYNSNSTNSSDHYLSIQAIEVIYRIFAVILKNLCKENIDYNKLLEFLNDLVQRPFFKAHDDYFHEKIDGILSDMASYENPDYKDSYLKCVCICITGLNQILTRYPQHYRAVYRLANFYANYLNNKGLEYAKDLLLGNAQWKTLAHMPCGGLFSEKTKMNLFNNIYRPSLDDINRAGNFCNHFFKIIQLIITVLNETLDLANLLDLSRKLFLSEKKFFDGFYNDLLSSSALATTVDVLSTVSTAAITSTVKELDKEVELTKALLDGYEIYKLVTKVLVAKLAETQQILKNLYFAFKPAMCYRANEITNDDVIKFCQQKERQEKSLKAAAAAKAKVNLQQQQQQQNIITIEDPPQAAVAPPATIPATLDLDVISQMILQNPNAFQQQLSLPNQRSHSPFTIADLLGEDMNF